MATAAATTSATAPATKTSGTAPATTASGTAPATTASGTTPATTGTSGESPSALETPPAEVPPEKKPSIVKGKAKGKVKDKNAKPKREYMYWDDAFDIEWRAEIEFTGWKMWKTKFGPGTEWWSRYEQWVNSGNTRGVMRKPSFRGLEWLKWKRGIETAPVGECCTRHRCGVRDYFIEPVENYCCRPCPYPRLTSQEIGWLVHHNSCQLEIYPNDFMKKPPLPWHHRKISTLQPGNM